MPNRLTAASRSTRISSSQQTSARPALRNRPAAKHAAGAPLTIDPQHTLALVMELMAIRGRSGQEGAVAEYITRKLRGAGAPASALTSDNAHHHTPLQGEVGN